MSTSSTPSLTWTVAKLYTSSITSVSCPTTSFCAAGNIAGDIVYSTDPTGGASAWSVVDVDGSNSINAISCPTASFCLAVDSVGNIVYSTDPTGGASAWSVVNVDGSTAIDGVSCPNTSLCLAGDSAGNLLSSTDPTGGASAWSSTSVAASGGSFGQLACLGNSTCVALATNATIIATSNWRDPSNWISYYANISNLTSLSCPVGSGFCVASGYNGGVGYLIASTSPTNPSSWNEEVVDTSYGVQSVSCATTSFCVAGDDGNYILTSTDPTNSSSWSISGPVDPSHPPMWAMSCPSTTLCVGGDETNIVVGTASSPTSSSMLAYTPLPAPTRICDTRPGNPSGLSGLAAQCND
ncbi:MAG: hypothetical protein M1131_03925, partial [Actinobacteria bacterium]|nr:hypothetical protein [Actinomycetota bacterium]MCL6094279.1 hypothetical protein [Actinomycetota bacterium]